MQYGGHLKVQDGHHLGEKLHQGHVHAPLDQILGHLQTDEPAAHHHRLPHLARVHP